MNNTTPTTACCDKCGFPLGMSEPPSMVCTNRDCPCHSPTIEGDTIGQIVRDCTSVEPRAKSEIRRRIETLLISERKRTLEEADVLLTALFFKEELVVTEAGWKRALDKLANITS